MKKDMSRDLCSIDFEEGEAFAGKAILLRGERVSDGFQFYRQGMNWIVVDENGKNILVPIEDEVKDKLIVQIINEGVKQNFKFELW